MKVNNGHVRRSELADVLKQSGAIAARTGVGKAERQAAIDNVAREIVKLHDRLVEIEIDRGIRKAAPVRKANASLGEQLRDIAGERLGGRGGSWSGVFD